MLVDAYSCKLLEVCSCLLAASTGGGTIAGSEKVRQTFGERLWLIFQCGLNMYECIFFENVAGASYFQV